MAPAHRERFQPCLLVTHFSFLLVTASTYVGNYEPVKLSSELLIYLFMRFIVFSFVFPSQWLTPKVSALIVFKTAVSLIL